ncbi:regulatory protein SipA [Synechococcus elongatus]|uniref:Uncharacterized protein SEF0032 n=2 Tax=Synechococcus elongatus TaxID=32046 RepID=Q8KPR2_SYNE7|nr:DUF3148 domain-containing protein [Synechococcus elongatus]AAM82707.1 unknown [Synechococcus elongatus PCC 7942 = FACHB-805]ABB57226.1 conserved hypothetical protein [Synechococcus elongatus PCC 7942 = FACHB-805]AJD58261.1 hypothetical protein M744_10670 [Synechococcus elongatus UTEX 2973]MBD2587631.1 DUF3148 domain-containing protein [Synechococcus elongatus FACHB-242]MBD2688590.1 DUF3148 domain-containing protein [Synechococcus elongatus FACHB-1061]
MDFAIGDRVRLAAQPPYLKSADPLPMLRPPDLLAVGEQGTITGLRPGGYWVVLFDRGSFLLDTQFLSKVESGASSSEG